MRWSNSKRECGPCLEFVAPQTQKWLHVRECCESFSFLNRVTQSRIHLDGHKTLAIAHMDDSTYSSTDTAPKSAKPARGWALLLAPVAFVAALIGIAVAAGAFWESRTNVGELQQVVGAKLAEQGNALKDSSIRNEQMLRDLREAQNRVAQLEGKLGEIQGQRVALEEMYRELARAPDDWLLAEVEQTLNIASRELTLAGNVRAALIALQTADQRLARADKLQVVQLRRAITQDMERLKAVPIVDTQGVSVKLDTLMSQTATLPLMLPDTLSAAEREAKPANDGDNMLVRFSKDLWFEMKQLVRIRKLEGNDIALLSPQQSYFVRENLKLRLLSARTALIARDEANYKEDLKLAREMMAKYFDPKAKVNVNAIAMLKQLAESPVSIATPDITTSLTAIRAARAARERPAR
jgi:uroporphyrin-III C-methyltransferase